MFFIFVLQQVKARISASFALNSHKSVDVSYAVSTTEEAHLKSVKTNHFDNTSTYYMPNYNFTFIALENSSSVEHYGKWKGETKVIREPKKGLMSTRKVS